jgi:hypothetical protein
MSDSVVYTRTKKVIFIVFVVLLFCIVFAHNIPALHVDSASHYSLVDKIERDFFINQGYIENLGEMSGYPPIAHYAAAFFNIFTHSGLVSMNIVNILTLALGWTVIAVLLLETSVFALLLMAVFVAWISASGAALPLFGMEVTGENFLYSQFVSSGFFIGFTYLIYKVNLSMTKRIILSLVGFYVGMHIHALFALVFFAGSFFYFTFLEYVDGINNKLSKKNYLLIGLYAVIGSAIFFTDFYTQFANIIRKHNGSLAFSGFSHGPEDVTLLSYVFIFVCLFMTIAGLALYRFHRIFRSKFKANFVLVNSFLLGVSVLAATQSVLLYFGEVSPYVVKKYLFGAFTLFLILVVIYISVYAQQVFQKLNSSAINQSKVLAVILAPALFVLMISFNWSKSPVDLVSITNAQKVAKQYFNESKGDPSYRNTIAQFQNLTMPMNWLITIGDLQVYKWSQLSHVVVHQIPHELPDSAFVLTDARADNVKNNGLLDGQYQVYSAEALYGPILLESGKKYLLNSTNPDVIRFFEKGFSVSENWGTWSSEEEAELQFVVQKTFGKNVSVSLTAVPWLAKGRERFMGTASVDGVKVAEREFSVPGSVEWEFEVPGKYVGANGEIVVRLNFTNPATPLSVGQSEDPRVLGLGIQSLTVTYE